MINVIATLMIAIVFRRSTELPVPGGTKILVDFGKTAEIQCTSNDHHHNFFFWQISSPEYAIIGPGNHYDRLKYEYEVLSGKLIIRAVTEEEEGVYNCVSRGVRNDSINIRPVTLVVRKDWQLIYEEDPTVNFFRAVIVVGSVAIVLGGAYLIHSYYTSKSSSSYLDPSDEDESTEEPLDPTEPSTSMSTQRINKDIHRHEDESYENTALSTDFENFLINTTR